MQRGLREVRNGGKSCRRQNSGFHALPNPLSIVAEIGKSANLGSATSPGWPQAGPRWPGGLVIGCLRATDLQNICVPLSS